MKFSIIIPTVNEAETIGDLIDYLTKNSQNHPIEIIISDGGSSDKTVEIAKRSNVIVLHCPNQGRAHQMNFAAKHASGEILYFVHADTHPPESYITCIIDAIAKGFPSGCCAYAFDSKSLLLKIQGYFSKFNGFYTGGGDQTLYIKKELFEEFGGFNRDFVIMEDFELTRKLMQKSKFKVIATKGRVSARKYEKNSYFRVNSANMIALFMFWFGSKPEKIKRTYKSIVRY